jgi:hypothetical protein
MKPFEVITHKEKKIAILDLSDTTPAQAITLLREAQKKITLMPLKSVRIFTDATNAAYNKESMEALKEFSLKAGPHIKASATTGQDGMRGVAKKAVETTVKREINSFKSRQEALDWLASKE